MYSHKFPIPYSMRYATQLHKAESVVNIIMKLIHNKQLNNSLHALTFLLLRATSGD